MKTNDKKPAPEPKPEEILKAKVKYHSDNFAFTGLNHLPYFLYPVVIEVMQEYADLYHKEKLRGEFDKINCLTGYLERWLNNPLSVPPFELKDVIRESNEWIEDYLKKKE